MHVTSNLSSSATHLLMHARSLVDFPGIWGSRCNWETSAPVFTATIQWAPSLDSLGELFFFLFKLGSYLNFLYRKEATSSTFKRPAMLPALV
jgi:hypothetical protein